MSSEPSLHYSKVQAIMMLWWWQKQRVTYSNLELREDFFGEEEMVFECHPEFSGKRNVERDEMVIKMEKKISLEKKKQIADLNHI